MENKIGEFMKAKGVTNVALAEAIGISKVAVSNIVTGKAVPSMDKAIAIAQYLGVSVEALAGVDPEAPKEEVVESLSFVCPHCGNSVTIKVTK